MKKSLLFLSFLLLLNGCVSSIESLQKSPERYNDKDINVKGSVLQVTAPPLVPAELLEIYDQTGKLLVLNLNKGEFQVNDKVNIKGRLYTLNNKTMDQTLQSMEKKVIEVLTKNTQMDKKQAQSQASLLFGLLKGFLKDKVNLMVLIAY